LLVFENGTLEAHLGNYSDWRAYRKSQAAATPVPEPPSPVTQSATEITRAAKKDRERTQRRLERLVESLEAEVARIETELASLRAQLAADHGGDWQKLHALADRERELGDLLGRRMGDWEKASAELQKFLEDARTG
jgi:ATP-binding cassette subfamily F protein 3